MTASSEISFGPEVNEGGDNGGDLLKRKRSHQRYWGLLLAAKMNWKNWKES